MKFIANATDPDVQCFREELERRRAAHNAQPSKPIRPERRAFDRRDEANRFYASVIKDIFDSD